jgi:hypothetical protein
MAPNVSFGMMDVVNSYQTARGKETEFIYPIDEIPK